DVGAGPRRSRPRSGWPRRPLSPNTRSRTPENRGSSIRPRRSPRPSQLLRRLLAEGDQESDDLRWLYSDLEEYSPSGLVGRPIPAPALPERGEGSRRKWDPSWRRFALGNYILTGATLAIAGASALIPDAPDRWRGKNQFDESVRDSIGIVDYGNGQWARDVSDVGLAVSIMNPLLVDSLVITYWYRQSEDVA